jgi:hypothetical protein
MDMYGLKPVPFKDFCVRGTNRGSLHFGQDDKSIGMLTALVLAARV